MPQDDSWFRDTHYNRIAAPLSSRPFARHAPRRVHHEEVVDRDSRMVSIVLGADHVEGSKRAPDVVRLRTLPHGRDADQPLRRVGPAVRRFDGLEAR
jgi:hypothetical protein